MHKHTRLPTMHLYTYTYLLIHIHTKYTYAHTSLCTHTRTHAHTHKYVYAKQKSLIYHTHICTYHTHICTHTHTCTYHTHSHYTHIQVHSVSLLKWNLASFPWHNHLTSVSLASSRQLPATHPRNEYSFTFGPRTSATGVISGVSCRGHFLL